jgi:hypothetical protein
VISGRMGASSARLKTRLILDIPERDRLLRIHPQQIRIMAGSINFISFDLIKMQND